MRPRPIRAAGLLALLAVAGCSQAAALAPVGGNRVTDVRFAAGDVLVRQHVELLVAPVCTMAADRAVTCTGTALDGRPITVVSPAADQASMQVSIGTETLYSGGVQEVLDESARPAS